MKSYKLALLGCMAAMSLGSLQAASLRVAKVQIPFEFRVDNTKLPAGEYRVEHQYGSEIAMLVNVDTGKRVQMLRPTSMRTENGAKITFARTKDGLKLKLS